MYKDSIRGTRRDLEKTFSKKEKIAWSLHSVDFVWQYSLIKETYNLPVHQFLINILE